jgi:hypothetical protein
MKQLEPATTLNLEQFHADDWVTQTFVCSRAKTA